MVARNEVFRNGDRYGTNEEIVERRPRDRTGPCLQAGGRANSHTRDAGHTLCLVLWVMNKLWTFRRGPVQKRGKSAVLVCGVKTCYTQRKVHNSSEAYSEKRRERIGPEIETSICRIARDYPA